MSKIKFQYSSIAGTVDVSLPLEVLPNKDAVQLFWKLSDMLSITVALTEDPKCHVALDHIDACLKAYWEDERP